MSTAYNKNYPLLPQMPYRKTTVEMGLVIPYIKSLDRPFEVKRATYIVFRNEGANGSKGVQNNYIGLQSDGGKFPNDYSVHFNGFCIKNENLTDKSRGFLCFDKWQSSIDILADEIQNRGLYVGGKLHEPYYVSFTDVTNDNFCQAYEDLWVYGNKDYKPTKIEVSDFNSMYEQSIKLFI